MKKMVTENGELKEDGCEMCILIAQLGYDGVRRTALVIRLKRFIFVKLFDQHLFLF